MSSEPQRTVDDLDVLRAHVARLVDLGTWTATLVHELRQPVFALQAAAEMALAAGEPAARWRPVLDQVAQLRALLDRYGSYGRDDATPAGPLTDLARPVQAAVEMVAQRCRGRGVHVVVSLHATPLYVAMDEVGLRQIALNLVQNAVDALDGVETREVRVSVRADGAHAVLEVGDSGPGLPEHLAERAFDAFVTSKPPGEGTGLGLYVTRQLVQRAGGVIQIASMPGQGTVVRVSLPCPATLRAAEAG